MVKDGVREPTYSTNVLLGKDEACITKYQPPIIFNLFVIMWYMFGSNTCGTIM